MSLLNKNNINRLRKEYGLNIPKDVEKIADEINNKLDVYISVLPKVLYGDVFGDLSDIQPGWIIFSIEKIDDIFLIIDENTLDIFFYSSRKSNKHKYRFVSNEFYGFCSSPDEISLNKLIYNYTLSKFINSSLFNSLMFFSESIID